ncbi:MAG: excinuclease ABC subunit UvrC [Clostridiales bacterium]|nr:excinuclease ABC subunit UvrC [Clostridiales bacterium]
MTKEELKEKAHSLPLQPGVYIMMDKAGEVIYVGKSRALKNRVSQYFADLASHTGKTRAMVSQIDHFDYILADSEFEALVLENSLIKRHKPKYNILLKDDKGYPYIRLSVKDEYPRFSLASKAVDDGARYFGPYGSRGSSYEIIKTVSAALRLPTCKKKFPRDIGKERPCLNHHLGTCDGWCQPTMTAEEYQTRIRQAIRLLDGKFAQVEKELEEEMLQASAELRFENAAELRDRLQAIQLLGTRQKVVAGAGADTDVVGFYRGEAKSCFVVLHFLDGALADRDTELLPTPMEEDEQDVVSALVSQYYGDRGNLPRQILLPCQVEGREALQQLLTQAAGRKVELLVPQRGDKVRLVELAGKNAADEAERATTKEERQNRLMELLGSMMGLENVPHRFEAYDISNTGAADIVASMTVFVDGKPLKKDYRRFRLKDMTAPDDYASMEQVLTRRFRRYLDGDEKFNTLPDVLLMDGGLGQVHAAEAVLETMGLTVPVFGMVKDGRHRTRALVAGDGREIGIQSNQAIFSMIGRIQEETHRFAITYHRESHAKHTVSSALEAIPGVGEARRKALMKQFKSVKNIRAASYDELCQAVPKNAAKAVYTHFHPEEETN